MSKQIKFKTAMIAIRSLFAPVRVSCVEDPRCPKLCNVFVGAKSIASFTGDSWEEVIAKIMEARAQTSQSL